LRATFASWQVELRCRMMDHFTTLHDTSAGQIGLEPTYMRLPPDIDQQISLSLSNTRAVLDAVDSSPSLSISATFYITSLECIFFFFFICDIDGYAHAAVLTLRPKMHPEFSWNGRTGLEIAHTYVF
jgi:enamine deaminase RidA (YjgF/YER057c/UK114 family)